MPGLAIKYSPVPPDKLARLQERFTALGSALLDTQPAMERVGEQIQTVIAATFESQGRRGGGSWHQLSDDTIRRKTGVGKTTTPTDIAAFGGGIMVRGRGGQFTRSLEPGDPRILFDTHRLYNSLTSRGGSDSIFVAGPDFIRVGTNLGYSRDHWFGTRRMPQRRFYQPTVADKARYVDIVRRYFWTAFTGGEGRMGASWRV